MANLHTLEFFERRSLAKLDELALKLNSIYTGPQNYWLYYFRRGMEGVSNRIAGVELHYNAIHSWYPPRVTMFDVEFHLASLFFCMDSSMECLVYALNSLGNAISPAGFHDITSEQMLRRIQPANVTDARLVGYGRYFANFRQHWQNHTNLVEVVTMHHDVSKHRHASFEGGQSRMDPPAEFLQLIKAPGNEYKDYFQYAPWDEIILSPEVKLPMGSRSADWRAAPFGTLEKLAPAFASFLDASFEAAVSDVSAVV